MVTYEPHFEIVLKDRIHKQFTEDQRKTQTTPSLDSAKILETREALFEINVLLQRCFDINQELYACYNDLEKAFDKVKHDKLLVSRNIDSNYVKLISNLYWYQKSNATVENHLTEKMKQSDASI